MKAENTKDILKDFQIITERYDAFFVTAILGDPKVGKTSIINRMFEGTFSENYEKSTKFEVRDYFFQKGKKRIKIMIYLVSGERGDVLIRSQLLKRIDCPIIVYDMSSRESIENIKVWLNEIESYAKPKKVIIVGNKNDLKREFTLEDFEHLRSPYNTTVMDCSAKEDKHIKAIFEFLGQYFFEQAFGNGAKEEKK